MKTRKTSRDDKVKKAGKTPARKTSRSPGSSTKSALSKATPSKAAKKASSKAVQKKSVRATTARAKGSTTAPRARSKVVEEAAPEPHKKHVLIKRKKEDEALPSEVSSPAFPEHDASETVPESSVLPEVVAVAQVPMTELPAVLAPDIVPAVEQPSSPVVPEPVAVPPAQGGMPEQVKTGDEKTKATDDAKQKKIRKSGKPRDADLFAEIYEDAARWQDLRPLPALRRDERSRHIPSSTSTEVTKPRKKTVKLAPSMTVKEFAERLGVRVADVIRKLMEMGTACTMNQPMDMDAGVLIAEEVGVHVEVQTEKASEGRLEDLIEPTNEAMLVPRAPVVTIMGHVDHGKTSLLDAIRQTNVTDREAGGITQHIGAYSVQVGEKTVTFLDTPGHEAFTAMRARGAQVTDMVVLVVAADDGVMPQTIEAANHARAAGVPILVAINKIDLPGANLDRIKQGLSDHGLVPENWGGQTIYSEVSAKDKRGVETLLEMILLQAEVMELQADRACAARGVVLEAQLDRGRGPMATVLVHGGVLKVGDAYVVGATSGRVRAMVSYDGKQTREAGPSTPVKVMGLLGLPAAGDQLVVVKEEWMARELATSRQQKLRAAGLVTGHNRLTLDDLLARGQKPDKKVLSVLLKADTQGSVGALRESVSKLSSDAVMVQILHQGVGGITESDVLLASASKALVIGFHVRPEPKATVLAEREGVDIRLHTIIYRAISDLEAIAQGLLDPTLTERVLGRAEVRQVFTIPKVGTIAGSYVHDGQIARASEGIRLLRDNVVVHEGTLGSLRRFKDDVREVQQGYECGIGIENFNDIKIGDVIEAYVFDKEAARL